MEESSVTKATDTEHEKDEVYPTIAALNTEKSYLWSSDSTELVGKGGTATKDEDQVTHEGWMVMISRRSCAVTD